MPEATQEKWLAALRRAARAGRKEILEHYDELSRRKVLRRGAGGDLTLLIDEVSEKAILGSLSRDLGEDSFVFVSEELGEARVKDKEKLLPVVVCDPLDGSHNAQVGVPFCSVSIAVLGARQPMPRSRRRLFGDTDVALVESVMTSDEYAAVKGKGSFHNGRKIERRASAGQGRIETLGIECSDIDYLKQLVDRMTKKRVKKVRVLGSVAMSMSLLAGGALDALVFAQPGGARSIDSAAGYLIGKEAGCTFSDIATGAGIESAEVGFHSRLNILGARSGRVHRELVRLVREP